MSLQQSVETTPLNLLTLALAACYRCQDRDQAFERATRYMGRPTEAAHLVSHFLKKVMQ